MDAVEIGYASNQQIADKMIEKVSSTDGFEFNTYNSYQATLDYMEINNEAICFEENIPLTNNNNDLLVQFAMLWGMEIGSALSSKEVEIANEMKLWNSDELFSLFSSWKDEYLSQDDLEDSVEFFKEKVTDLLHE